MLKVSKCIFVTSVTTRRIDLPAKLSIMSVSTFTTAVILYIYIYIYIYIWFLPSEPDNER